MSSKWSERLAVRIEQIQGAIANSAKQAGRDPAGIQLVAVTKTVELETIQVAYELGLRHFGENRVEEAEDKIRSSSTSMPDVTWHMIGHIQSRKADEVGRLFPWVHSVDRGKIARRLGASASEQKEIVNILLEVNVSGEASKHGFDLAQWPENPAPLDALASEIREIDLIDALRIRGLMTMAPFYENPELARPVFRKLRLLRDALQKRFPSIDWAELSMGMTADFEVAIAEGASMVRIGTGIFGSR